MILIVLIIVILLSIYYVKSQTNKDYQAIYFTDSKSPQIENLKTLKDAKILVVNDFNKLKKIKIDNNSGIIIDKSTMQGNMKELNEWLKKQVEIPIIVVGYGNPTYAFFKKFIFTDENKIPDFSDEKFKEFSKQKGFSFAYIAKSGEIYGKGFKGKIDINNISEIIAKAKKGEKEVQAIVNNNN